MKAAMQIGIGLFVYNRPWHTRQVLDGLQRNNIDKLYVFCDGPKAGDVDENIALTRDLVQSIDWCETRIILHNDNLGTVDNLVFGINTMFEENEAVIYLEDDCVPRDDFWYYMSTCLHHYRHYGEVMQVNGYQLPIKIKRRPQYDVYFAALAMSWGFGLWRRSWQLFRMDVSDAVEYLKKPESKRLTDLCPLLQKGVQRVLSGELNSFTYRWNYIINLNNGFCVAPFESLVRNVGLDGTGVHCGVSTLYDTDISASREDLFGVGRDLKLPDTIVFDEYMDAQTPYFYGKRRPVDRVKKQIKRLLSLHFAP